MGPLLSWSARCRILPHQPWSQTITRRVVRLLLVLCRAPAKWRRQLQTVVLTPSHCAFFRALASNLLDIGPTSFIVGKVPDSATPAIVPKHHPTGCSLIARPLHGPRNVETPIADGSLDALALCLLQGLGVLREVTCALSALAANDP